MRLSEVARCGQRLLHRPRSQQRLRPVLRRAAPQLLKPDRSRASEPVGQVPKRRAPPQRERIVQEAGGLRGIGVHPRPAGVTPLLEQVRVQPCSRAGPSGSRATRVTTRTPAGPSARRSRATATCTAFSTDSGWASPQTISARRYTGTTAPGSSEERGEQGAGTRSAWGDHVARPELDLERAQHLEQHGDLRPDGASMLARPDRQRNVTERSALHPTLLPHRSDTRRQ